MLSVSCLHLCLCLLFSELHLLAGLNYAVGADIQASPSNHVSMSVLSGSFSAMAHRFRPKKDAETTRIEPVATDQASSSLAQADGILKPEFKVPFLTLPNELLLVIVDELGGRAIRSLRLTCRAFYFLTEANQSSIVRRLSKPFSYPQCYCYPPLPFTPKNPLSDFTFNGYYNMIHRHNLLARLCDIITDCVEGEILRVRGKQQSEAFRIHRWNFAQNTYQRLRHVLQWFTVYQEKLVETVETCSDVSHTAISREILQSFGKLCLLHCYGLFKVLWLVITMKLRPSRTKTIGPFVPRWTKADSNNKDIIECLLFGGFEAIADILSLKGHKARRAALQTMVGRIERDAGVTSAVKSERLGRLSRVFTRRRTDQGNSLRTYESIFQGDAHRKSALPEITCSTLAKMSPDAASKILKQLPNVDSLFFTAAKEVARPSPVLAHYGDTITWALTRDSHHYIFDLLTRVPMRGEGVDSGTEASDSEDSEGENTTV